jgi:hypothetical protein
MLLTLIWINAFQSHKFNHLCISMSCCDQCCFSNCLLIFYEERVNLVGKLSAFLAHLTTKWSWWGIVMGLFPASVVVRRASFVVNNWVVNSLAVTVLMDHHQTLSKCLSQWNTDRVRRWVISGQKLGHRS